MRQISMVILHCSASSNANVDIDEVRRWHVQGRGWRDVGYHYFLTTDGEVQVGRSEDTVGSHCVGHNANSIGICLNGLIDEDFTEAQFEALEELLRELHGRYPLATLHGHQEFNSGKTCPVFDYSEFVDFWNSMSREYSL